MMKKIKNQGKKGFNLTFSGISSGKEFPSNDMLVQACNPIFFRCSLTGGADVHIQEMGMLYLPAFVAYAYFITCQYFALSLSLENYVFFW